MPGFPVNTHPTLRDALQNTYGFLCNPSTFDTAGDMIFSGHTRFVVASIAVGVQCILDRLVDIRISSHPLHSSIHFTHLIPIMNRFLVLSSIPAIK